MDTERWYILGRSRADSNVWLCFYDAFGRWAALDCVATRSHGYMTRRDAEVGFSKRSAQDDTDMIVGQAEFEAILAADRARRALEEA